VGNHKLIISTENVKNIEPRTNFISLSPFHWIFRNDEYGYEHITKKKYITLALYGGHEDDR